MFLSSYSTFVERLQIIDLHTCTPGGFTGTYMLQIVTNGPVSSHIYTINPVASVSSLSCEAMIMVVAPLNQINWLEQTYCYCPICMHIIMNW